MVRTTALIFGSVLLGSTAAHGGLLIQMDFNEGSTKSSSNLAPAATSVGDPGSTSFSLPGNEAAFTSDDAPAHTPGGWAGTFPNDITWGDANAFDSLDSLTMSAWINPAAITDTMQIMEKNEGGGGGGYRMSLVDVDTTGSSPDYRLEVELRVQGDGLANQTSVTLLSDFTIVLNQWQFVAVTADLTGLVDPGVNEEPDTVVLYLGDGVNLTSEVNTGNYGFNTQPNGGDFGIGSRIKSGSDFNGLIDNARLYGNSSDSSDFLSASQIQSVMQYNDVPEPASLALLGLGGLMVLGRRRQ